MVRRSKDWNEELATDLQDPDFVRDFLLAALEEGIALQQALGKVVRAFGVQEFARKVGMASSNLQRAIDPKHNPTQETLNRMLAPFGLKVGLTRIDQPTGQSAA
jgi:probable addiction module antidote protein